jgi:hypothetical protein
MKGLPVSFGKKISVVSDQAHDPAGLSKETLHQDVLRLRGEQK